MNVIITRWRDTERGNNSNSVWGHYFSLLKMDLEYSFCCSRHSNWQQKRREDGWMDLHPQ